MRLISKKRSRGLGVYLEGGQGFCQTLERVQEERERFIKGIDKDAICRLASSYHNGEPCSIFKEPSYGSYNLCIYVAFSLSGDRWVIRIPIVPCLASVEEKLEQEVGAM